MTAYIIIFTVFTLIMLGLLLYIVWQHRRMTKLTGMPAGASFQRPKDEDLLASIAVEPFRSAGKPHEYMFTYKHHTFNMDLPEDTPMVNMELHGTEGYDPAFRMWLMDALNQCNGTHGGISVDTWRHKEDQKWYVHVMGQCCGSGLLTKVTEDVCAMLDIMIEKLEFIESAMREGMLNADRTEMGPVNERFMNLMHSMSIRQEVRHEFGAQQVEQATGDLSVCELLSLYGLPPSLLPSRLTLIAGSKPRELTDADTIMNFDFRNYLRDQQVPLTRLLAMVDTKEATVMMLFTLTTDTISKTFCYDLLVCSSLPIDSFPPMHTLVEVRFGGERGDYWELKYMLDDARDKIRQNHAEDLSPEQWMMMSVDDPKLQPTLYWAKRLYIARCYPQSLHFFLDAWRLLSADWDHLTERGRKLFYDICQHIGYIYMEIGQPDRAFYYLQKTGDGQTIEQMKEYCNALIDLHDPHAMKFLQNIRRQTLDRQNALRLGPSSADADQQLEVLDEVQRFLNRRMAYLLIELNRLDEAETSLKAMLANGVDEDFAKEELDYIRELREQNEARSSTPPEPDAGATEPGSPAAGGQKK